MTTPEQQKVYSARWMEKLKADPVRYEKHMERVRARDRARPYRRPKQEQPRNPTDGQRLTASKLTHTAKKYTAKRPGENRPETERNLKEVYRLGQAGQRVHKDRLDKLRERRERNDSIDEAVARLTGQPFQPYGIGSGAGGGGGGGAC